MVVVTYAVETTLVATSVSGAVAFMAYFANGEMNFAPIGMSIMCAGGALLMVFACIGATKGSIKLSKKIVTGIKMLIIGKKGK